MRLARPSWQCAPNWIKRSARVAVDAPRRVEVTKAVQATVFRAGQQMTTDETNVVPFAPRRLYSDDSAATARS
jgi:hypothetical protein